MEVKYFFDSYAVIELLKANPQYIKYGDFSVVFTYFNLVEVTYAVLRDAGEEKAKEIYRKFEDCVEEIDEETVMEALKVKQKYNKRDLSYADCIGYAVAKRKKILFLTGDSDFKDLENVEFVK